MSFFKLIYLYIANIKYDTAVEIHAANIPILGIKIKFIKILINPAIVVLNAMFLDFISDIYTAPSKLLNISNDEATINIGT